MFKKFNIFLHQNKIILNYNTHEKKSLYELLVATVDDRDSNFNGNHDSCGKENDDDYNDNKFEIF